MTTLNTLRRSAILSNLSFKRVICLFLLIFSVWLFYRYSLEIFPVWVEELFIKPLLWLGPTFWWVFKVESKSWDSLGLRSKNLTHAIYWGLGLGMLFALEGFWANVIKYHGLNWAFFEWSPWEFMVALFISLVTAMTEEIVFRGYIFTRLNRAWRTEWLANLFSAGLFTLMYLPLTIFVLGLQMPSVLIYLSFVFIFGMAAAFIFARTGNLAAAVLLHIFWNWPVVLFR